MRSDLPTELRGANTKYKYYIQCVSKDSNILNYDQVRFTKVKEFFQNVLYVLYSYILVLVLVLTHCSSQGAHPPQLDSAYPRVMAALLAFPGKSLKE